MLSVITPTMWKSPPFLDFLKYVLKQDSVGEVIIINNNVNETPQDEILENSKVRVINCNENLFVNPSWNLGAELSQFETLCFLSDDVIVDLRVFDKADTFIKSAENLGMVYICPGYENQDQPKVTTGEIEFETGVVMNRYGYGSLFFVKKEDWIPIPNELKVWYGDHVVFMNMQHLKKVSYYIKNCLFVSPWGVTVREIGGKPDFNVNDDAAYKLLSLPWETKPKE